MLFNKIKYCYNKFLKLCSTGGLIVLTISVYFGNVYTTIIALIIGLILQLFIILSDSRTNMMFFTGPRKKICLFFIYFILGAGVKSLFIILNSNIELGNKLYTCFQIISIFVIMPVIANILLLGNSKRL